ncbi:MAG: hypothetical protein ACXWQO_02955 [Bdellovibrionota bacterium]
MCAIALATLIIGSQAFAGGVSGGGGNSKPLHPVTPEQVKLMIETANRYVIGHLNFLENNRNKPELWKGHEKLPAKLFDYADQVTDWALRLPITIKEDGPCLDLDGNEMDGSAAWAPAAICISVPRLVAKLSRESLRSEVVALVLHEYSHLVETTEEEADFLQTNAIEYFFRADFNQFENDIREASNSFYDLRKFADSADTLAPESPELWNELYLKLDRLLNYLGNQAGWGREGIFTFVSGKFREQFSTVFLRIDFMKASACVLRNGAGAANCREHLDRYFQQDEEIDYHTFMLRTGHKPGDFKERPGVFFRRWRTRVDAQLELMRLGKDVGYFRHYLNSMLAPQE